MLVKARLIRISSYDPDEDHFVQWLRSLNVWGIELEYRTMATKGFIPLDIECRVKDQLGLPLDRCSIKLFSQLIGSDIGIFIHTLGYNDGGWRDPDTCVGRLLSLHLARVQDEKKLKALPIAFDPRVKFLVGYSGRPDK